jgi:hypothetical protein
MAKSNNVLLKDSSGQLGKTLVMKHYSYGTVLSAYPNMTNVQFNPKQKAEQSRFSKAVAYAQSVLKDPAQKAAFAATLKQGQTVYNAAIKAYLSKN